MRRVDDALRSGLADLSGALQARLNGPGGQELMAEYWVFRNLQAVTRERWILVNSRVLELLSSPALVRARQATGAALLRWHDSLMALCQTSPHGVALARGSHPPDRL
jgi:hypothetical protein